MKLPRWARSNERIKWVLRDIPIITPEWISLATTKSTRDFVKALARGMADEGGFRPKLPFGMIKENRK